MRKFLLLAAAASLLAVPATAATIVNLDGKTNTSTTGSNGISLSLAAGSYTVTFVQDQYTAFSRWTSNAGCNASGELCRQGWENSARMITDDGTFYIGHAGGGYGPKPEESLYFASATQSLASLVDYAFNFTLSEAGTVKFFIYDTPVTDNRGGVSLSVAAVPEAATWAMLIAGFGLVGTSLRRRRQTPVVAN